ncbi:MAG: hypothetical protein U9R34_04095 [Nanoarchaeota archaeon]|nr:hypothetical protein [Nanoarchaeota archaeon]
MKNKKSSLVNKQGKNSSEILPSQLCCTLRISFLLGFLLTLAAGMVIFISFSSSYAEDMTKADSEIKIGITPLGFDIALLLVITISGIIIVFSSKKKKAKEKGGV